MSWRQRARFLPTRGGVALSSLTVGIFAISQTTGAGWLTVLASVSAGTVAVGIVWPLILVRSTRFEISGPADAVAGRPFKLNVRVDRPTSGLQFEIVGLTSDPVWAEPPAAGTVEVTAQRRGVMQQVEVDVTCSAPFDLFTGRFRVGLNLPDPIYVAPQPHPMQLPDRLLGGSGGDGGGAGGSGPGEMVRGLREYATGDAMRMVHWRASARRDHLLVKELEPPERPRLVLIVDVSHTDAEKAAGEAAGLIQTARRQGHPVTLATYEPTGRLISDVGSTREAGRRLAAAIPGEPPSGPFPEGSQIIRLGQTTGTTFS